MLKSLIYDGNQLIDVISLCYFVYPVESGHHFLFLQIAMILFVLHIVLLYKIVRLVLVAAILEHIVVLPCIASVGRTCVVALANDLCAIIIKHQLQYFASPQPNINHNCVLDCKQPNTYKNSHYKLLIAMLNKTKNEPLIKRNPSAMGNRRPKRCHLCKKSFAYDKYQQHFEQCYRFENKKIEENRARTNIKHSPMRNQSTVGTNKFRKAESIKKENGINPEYAQTTNKFRIKNTSNLTQKPKTNTTQTKPHLTSTRNRFNHNKQAQIKRQVQPKLIQEEEEIKLEKLQERQIQKEEEPIKQEETVSVNVRDYDIELINVQRRSPFPHQMEDDSQEELIGLGEVHQREAVQTNQQHSRTTQQIEPPRPQLINQRSVVMSSRQLLFAQDDQQQIPNEQPYDIQAVINNSNSIIQFIRGMNFMQEDETLSIMVSQLLQLNQIAEQISQLNLLGRSLALRMGNVFAARIHQLQTAIINQIGIALIRGFNDRLGVQFQHLTQIQPDLRVGFSEQQIQNLFPEKFNIAEKQCSICLQDMKRSQLVMQLQCKHTFHPSCIKQWLISSKKCPLCRSLQRHI